MARVSLVRLGGRVAYTRALALQRELARRRGNEAGNSVSPSTACSRSKLQTPRPTCSARATRSRAPARRWCSPTVAECDVSRAGAGGRLPDSASRRLARRWFVHALEDVMVETVAAFGIPAVAAARRRRVPGSADAKSVRSACGSRAGSRRTERTQRQPRLELLQMIAPCGLRVRPMLRRSRRSSVDQCRSTRCCHI